MTDRAEEISLLASYSKFLVDKQSPIINNIDSVVNLSPLTKRSKPSTSSNKEKDSRNKKARISNFYPDMTPFDHSTSVVLTFPSTSVGLIAQSISTSALSSLHTTSPSSAAFYPANLRLFNRTTSRSVLSNKLSTFNEATANTLEIRSGDRLSFYDSQNRSIVPWRVFLLYGIPQQIRMIPEGKSIYHVPRFENSPTGQICICAIYGTVEFHFLCIGVLPFTISLKDFYTLVLEKDPSRACQTLESIPLHSRLPFVLFRNQDGDEHFRGQTALHAAASAGHLQLVQLLLDSRSEKDAVMDNNCSAIYLASASGHYPVVKLLLDAGTDKNVPNISGVTPISIASANGHHQVVELLLDAGADKDACDKDGATALWMASFNGHHRVVAMLLAAGAAKNAPDKYRATPIFIASYNGHSRVVELLLAVGVDKNAQIHDGRTPIYVAAQNGHHEVVEVLLAAGAHLTLLWNDRILPQMAQQQSHTRIIRLLSGPLPQYVISAFLFRQSQLIVRLATLRQQYQSKQQQAASAIQFSPFKTVS